MKDEPRIEGVATADGRIRVGLGLGLVNLPEESDFKSEGVPFEAFLDYTLSEWIKYRIGCSFMDAAFSFGRTLSDGTTTKQATVENVLKTRVLYGAYRYDMKRWWWFDPYVMGGLAFIRSELTVDHAFGKAEMKESSIGYLMGGGGLYSFGDYRVGGQIMIISSAERFDDVELKVGSNQIQVVFMYSF
ncbi:MAG: porin family protein [Proteobacteria bacterium]|nr:porin family protein [Pseudomonadota bacterium]